MINEKDLIEIGKILKPHGVKGEMIFLFTQINFAETDNNFYFFLLDGTYVPFFIESFRFISNVSGIIKIEGINSLEEAINYNDTLIYLPSDIIQDAQEVLDIESEWERFIGFSIIDESGKLIGVIDSVDSSTMNVLFVVLSKEKELLIPATQDFIIDINSKTKQLQLNLPEGLIEN